jgi:hypothetical protein
VRGALGLAAAHQLAGTDARAQVNTESMRKRIKLHGASLILEGTFDGHTGNTQGLTADGLVGGGLATGPHLAFAFASADYSKLNGTLGVDKSFAHVRYNYEILPGSWWEAFVQAQSDVRVQSENGLVFKVPKIFSTSITFTAHYDSNPPAGVLPTDTELKNSSLERLRDRRPARAGLEREVRSDRTEVLS